MIETGGDEELPKKMSNRRKERKERQQQKKLLLSIFFLIVILIVVYSVWQYMGSSVQSEEPPPINTTNPLLAPYEFTIRDISGSQFSLDSYRGRVIVIHLMGVGCKGQIYPINDNQLTQLKSVCSSYCGNEPVTIVSVAVATCENSDLAQIRARYDVSWFFGNDVDDGTVDIAQNYASHGDGTIVIIDKDFQISEAYSTIDASTLKSKINQLLEA